MPNNGNYYAKNELKRKRKNYLSPLFCVVAFGLSPQINNVPHKKVEISFYLLLICSLPVGLIQSDRLWNRLIM